MMREVLSVMGAAVATGVVGFYFWAWQKSMETAMKLAADIRDGIALLKAGLYDESTGTPITPGNRATAASIDATVKLYASSLPFWRRGRREAVLKSWGDFYSQFKAKAFVKLYEAPEQQRAYAAYCEAQLDAVLDAIS